MNELDTRAERFLESIRAEGEAACAAIREETERAINTSWTRRARPRTPAWSAPCALRPSVPRPAPTAI